MSEVFNANFTVRTLEEGRHSPHIPSTPFISPPLPSYPLHSLHIPSLHIPPLHIPPATHPIRDIICVALIMTLIHCSTFFHSIILTNFYIISITSFNTRPISAHRGTRPGIGQTDSRVFMRARKNQVTLHSSSMTTLTSLLWRH